MTVAEAARLLEVRPGTVYSLCRAGLIGHLRIGIGRGTIRIEPEDVERFKLDARAKGSTAPSARPPTTIPMPLPRHPREVYAYKHIKPKG